MNDPLSSLQAPPPRYLLESDSSDEEGQGAYPSTSRKSSRPAPTYDISVNFDDDVDNLECLVIGVGQAGRYFAQVVGVGKRIGELKNGDEAVGLAYKKEGFSIMVVEESHSGEAAFAFADKLIQSVKARSW